MKWALSIPPSQEFSRRFTAALTPLDFSRIRTALLIAPYGLPWFPEVLKVLRTVSPVPPALTLLAEEGRQGREAGLEVWAFHRSKRGRMAGGLGIFRRIARRRFDLICLFAEGSPSGNPLQAFRLALLPARHRVLCEGSRGDALFVSRWTWLGMSLRFPGAWFSHIGRLLLRALFRWLGRPLVGTVLRGLPLVWEPICWIAGRREPRSRGEIRRILFIALDNPGDVLLTTPALTALKERFPSATITVLAGEWAREILAAHPAVSEMIPYSAPWFARYVAHLPHRPIRPVRDLLGCLFNLWRGRFDLTVETRGEAAHILLAYLSGAPHRGGYALWSVIPWLRADQVGHLLTRRVPYAWDQWNLWHKVEYNLRVVRPANGFPKDPSLVLPIPSGAERSVDEFLTRHGIRKDTLLIGAHPGASRERTRWPLAHFAEVLNSLAGRWGGRVVVIGSALERPLAEGLQRLLTAPAVLAVGETSLLEAAALVRRCRLVICNNSLITHLASATETPVVTVSRAPSNFYAPYRTKGVALTKELPCMNRGMPEGCACPFSEYWCLKEVAPEEVIAAAQELLRQPVASARGSLTTAGWPVATLS
ncbi:MAG: glycosyltransferase family 9 protein [Candidatus Omnitrophica bacterium]|nr:glycosyltransferase family 9 protein [Candidatus Omnitrophota bacterium]